VAPRAPACKALARSATGAAGKAERREFVGIGGEVAGGAFFDLAKAGGKPLVRGATYRARLGGRKITFKVDAKAKAAGKSGKTPIISRLLRFTPG
jgi:hypothetical protein